MTDMSTGNDFFETDEPLADVMAAFGAADKGVTAPHLPPGAMIVVPPRTFGPGAVSLASQAFPGVRVSKIAV